MMIVTGMKGLPVGQVHDPRAVGRTIKRVRRQAYESIRMGKAVQVPAHMGTAPVGLARQEQLEHPGGSSAQPFFTLREVTQAQYIAWYEREYDTVVTVHERTRDLAPSRQRFFEISLD